MPFADNDIRADLACGPVDGRWRGWYRVQLRLDALWPLGLHPDQPTAHLTGPSRPAWWHVAAERCARYRRRGCC